MKILERTLKVFFMKCFTYNEYTRTYSLFNFQKLYLKQRHQSAALSIGFHEMLNVRSTFKVQSYWRNSKITSC
jgi:hypothetical protein